MLSFIKRFKIRLFFHKKRYLSLYYSISYNELTFEFTFMMVKLYLRYRLNKEGDRDIYKRYGFSIENELGTLGTDLIIHWSKLLKIFPIISFKFLGEEDVAQYNHANYMYSFNHASYLHIDCRYYTNVYRCKQIPFIKTRIYRMQIIINDDLEHQIHNVSTIRNKPKEIIANSIAYYLNNNFIPDYCMVRNLERALEKNKSHINSYIRANNLRIVLK